MDRSIVAWPINDEKWFIQRRRVDRTYRASLYRECPVDISTTMRFYDNDISEFIASEYAELDYRNDDPWWRLPVEGSQRLFAHDEDYSGSAAIYEWEYFTDCDFGVDLANALGQQAHMLTTGDDVASRRQLTGRSVVSITATVRPDILAVMSAMGARNILPVFEFRSQLLIGPVLRAGNCPCPVCIVGRLAAHDVSLEAFISRCCAAGAAPHLFAARDITTGLPTVITAPAIETVVAAMHKLADRQVIAVEPISRMVRFNLVTGEVNTPAFYPLPGPSNDHWIRPSLQQKIGLEYPS